MLHTFVSYANYPFTVNNEGGISKDEIFRKFCLKFSKTIFFGNDNILE